MYYYCCHPTDEETEEQRVLAHPAQSGKGRIWTQEICPASMKLVSVPCFLISMIDMYASYIFKMEFRYCLPNSSSVKDWLKALARWAQVFRIYTGYVRVFLLCWWTLLCGFIILTTGVYTPFVLGSLFLVFENWHSATLLTEHSKSQIIFQWYSMPTVCFLQFLWTISTTCHYRMGFLCVFITLNFMFFSSHDIPSLTDCLCPPCAVGAMGASVDDVSVPLCL